MQKKEKNYFIIFAKMQEEAKIFVLERALNINSVQAKEMLTQIEQELKEQEALLHLTHHKANIENYKLIEKIKLLRAKNENKKREGAKAKFIRLHYFEIEKLRKQSLSWREIVAYIKTNHYKQISNVFLLKTFEKLQQQQEAKNVL